MERGTMRIGIDVGGTKIAVGLISESGKVTARRKVKTDAHKGYAAVRRGYIILCALFFPKRQPGLRPSTASA